MPDHRKPSKPPVPAPAVNGNAKALDRWNNEGGAPKGGQYHRERPHDQAQLAKLIVDVATGEVADRASEANGIRPAAVKRGRLGG